MGHVPAAEPRASNQDPVEGWPEGTRIDQGPALLHRILTPERAGCVAAGYVHAPYLT